MNAAAPLETAAKFDPKPHVERMRTGCHHFQAGVFGFQFLAFVFVFKLDTQLVIPVKGFGLFMVRALPQVNFPVVMDDLLGSLLNPV